MVFILVLSLPVKRHAIFMMEVTLGDYLLY